MEIFTIEEIKKSGILSPGLIDGVKMKFLHAGNDLYWPKAFDEEAYRKEKITLTQVINARHAYLSGFFDEEKEEAIEREFEKLGLELVKKATEIIKWIQQKHDLLHKTNNVFVSIMAQEMPREHELKKREAETFFKENPNAMESLSQLQTMIEQKDYEGLYNSIGDKTKPIFVHTKGSNIKVLANLFGALAIDQTITDQKEKGNLYLIAKVNVEKRYFP